MQQLSVAQTVLSQAVDLLDNYLTSDEQLTVHSKFLPGSTIGARIPSRIRRTWISCHTPGKHLRHARDHFVLLAESMNTPPPYILCYDTRIRNTPMETSRSCARQALMDTVKQLGEVVPDSKLNAPITLQAITPHMHEFQTTFGREVGSSTLHLSDTVSWRHSCGLQVCIVYIIGPWSDPYLNPWVAHLKFKQVRVIAGEMVCPSVTHLVTLQISNYFQGIKLTDDFGFAPSTLIYQGELCAHRGKTFGRWFSLDQIEKHHLEKRRFRWSWRSVCL